MLVGTCKILINAYYIHVNAKRDFQEQKNPWLFDLLMAQTGTSKFLKSASYLYLIMLVGISKILINACKVHVNAKRHFQEQKKTNFNILVVQTDTYKF